MRIAAPVLTPAQWTMLQTRQYKHDELFHRDLATMAIHSRMVHLVLHCAKYNGYLADAGRDNQKVFIDYLVIATSMANTLSIDLTTAVQDAPVLNYTDIEGPLLSRGASPVLVRIVGSLAALCERLDHLESAQYRTGLTRSVVSLVIYLTTALQEANIDYLTEVGSRLADIRQRSIFHDHIMDDPNNRRWLDQ